MKPVKFIPKELVNRNRWGFGDLNKRPMNGKEFYANKPNDKSQWYSLEECKRNYLKFKDKILGLGYVIFKEDNIVCIDIDHCIDENGVVSDLAKNITQRFSNTYQEKSVSGTGIHIFAKGTIPRNLKTKIEMYVDCHYMLFTGDTLNSKEIVDYNEELMKLYNEYSVQETKEIKQEKEIDMNNMYSIIDKIRSIPTEKFKFDKYYNGNCNIDSESTLGLASMLAFWTDKNHAMIKQIILSSGLEREKCYRKTKDGDWLDLVIEKAISNCRETYSPSLKNIYKENKKEIKEEAKEIDLVSSTLFYDIADIPYNTKPKERAYSHFYRLDKLIGGFTYNCITLWTAQTNGGKTTLLSFLTQEFLRQGRKIFYFNGEQDVETFKNTLYKQYIGKGKIKREKVPTCKIDGIDYQAEVYEYFVDDKYIAECDRQFAHNLFIYNNDEKHDVNNLLIAMEQCYEHYGVRDFVVDNLMQIDTNTSNELREQKDITERIRAFAVEKHCNIHLVAHPRKSDTQRIKIQDIAGTMNIPNKAYNVISLIRIDQLDKESRDYEILTKYGYNQGININECDCVLEVLKQKDGEGTGLVGLTYEPESRTFKEVPVKNYSHMIKKKRDD